MVLKYTLKIHLYALWNIILQRITSEPSLKLFESRLNSHIRRNYPDLPPETGTQHQTPTHCSTGTRAAYDWWSDRSLQKVWYDTETRIVHCFEEMRARMACNKFKLYPEKGKPGA